MSDKRYLPIPAGLVAENLEALQNAFTARRGVESVDAAFLGALGDVLSPSDRSRVLEAMAGNTADWPGFDGPEFGRQTASLLEASRQTKNAYRDRLDRRSTLDIVDLAEDLVTDQVLSGAYARAAERQDLQQLLAVSDVAVAMLLAKADEAITRVGRNVRIDQAAAVILHLGKKAQTASRAGNELAERQLQWCLSLRSHLNEHRKR